MRLFVLWEDQLAPGTGGTNYGPGALLRAAVTDRIATAADWYTVHDEMRREFESNPCKGVDKLLAELGQDRLYGGGRTILVIYDGDRIRRHLKVAPTTSYEQVNAVIEHTSGGRRLVARPIGANLEALIATMAMIPGSAVDGPELDVLARKASRGTALDTRDRVLQRHARGTDAMREFRRQLEQLTETWRDIVTAAVTAVRVG